MKELNIAYKAGADGMVYPEIDFRVTDKPMGKYGSLRGKFLREHKPDTYALLRMDGALDRHLHEIDKQAHRMLELLEDQYFQSNPLPKDGDFMKALHIRNSARSYAEEIILNDLIYN